MSTLKYYAKTNIESRPSKEVNQNILDFADYVRFLCWFLGQLKQNVPVFLV
jgi:phosphoenolpyruvate carboxylase